MFLRGFRILKNLRLGLTYYYITGFENESVIAVYIGCYGYISGRYLTEYGLLYLK